MDAAVRDEFKLIHKKLDKISLKLGKINVQEQHIVDMEAKLKLVCSSHNEAFKPDGVIANIQKFQASCPRDSNQRWIYGLWLALVACGSGLLTLIGILHKP